MKSKISMPTGQDSSVWRLPIPLLGVWGWELRRVFAKPLNWALALANFFFFMGMMWFKHAWQLGTDTGLAFTLYGTSAVGLLYEFTVVLMLVFAFILPFVVTEGVARDYKKRIHEMLMTTPLPTSAYVWGRFLAVLTIGLGQTVLMLFAALIMGSVLHLRNAEYSQPVLSILLNTWSLIVIPPTILISGIGFSLGTLWPRRAKMIILGILITWVLLFTVGSVIKIPNPTGIDIVGSLIPQLTQSANVHLSSIPSDQRAAWIQQLQATLPDLSGWVLPQFSLAVAGLLCVVIAAAGFRRFRNELD